MKFEIELEVEEVSELFALARETAGGLSRRNSPPKGMTMAEVILRSAMCNKVCQQVAAAIGENAEKQKSALRNPDVSSA